MKKITLILLTCVIAIMTSCGSTNNGLVKGGCGGITRLPKNHR